MSFYGEDNKSNVQPAKQLNVANAGFNKSCYVVRKLDFLLITMRLKYFHRQDRFSNCICMLFLIFQGCN